jgi:Domain of unknown function (DUF4384)
MAQVQILRIVVVSADDVQTERDLVCDIIEELNLGIAGDNGLRLELLQCDTDSYPGFHPEGAQGLIDPILKIADCNLLIGIFWKCLGTPTLGGITEAEHEFVKACEAGKEKGSPQAFIYFNQKPYVPDSEAEIEQWGKVVEFKDRFPAERLWWPYEDEAEFEKLLRYHLEYYIGKRLKPNGGNDQSADELLAQTVGSQVIANQGGVTFGDDVQGNITITGGVKGDLVAGDKGSNLGDRSVIVENNQGEIKTGDESVTVHQDHAQVIGRQEIQHQEIHNHYYPQSQESHSLWIEERKESGIFALSDETPPQAIPVFAQAGGGIASSAQMGGWETLLSVARFTDLIWPLPADQMQQDRLKGAFRGMGAPQARAGFSFHLGSRIALAIDSDRLAYLLLLNRGADGTLYCLCPSSFVPRELLPQGRSYFPQRHSRYSAFELSGKPGREHLLAILSDKPLGMNWYPSGPESPARLLDEADVELLISRLRELKAGSWVALFTYFDVSA